MDVKSGIMMIPILKIKQYFFFIFLILALTGCSDSFNRGNDDVADDGFAPSQEWQLVWSDEFNTGTLNESNWEIQEGDGKMVGLTRWGNNEDQYYRNSPNNLRVEVDSNDPNNDGSLVITTLADGYTTDSNDVNNNVAASPNQNFDFTSARITTRDKFEFTYGRVEARIKLDSSQGLWHAFWLLGSDASPYRSWPQKGEIDIMEAWVHDEGSVAGTAHFGVADYAKGVVHHEYRGQTFPLPEDDDALFDYNDGEYHLYAVEWDAEEIRWFVDGEHFYTLTQNSYWNFYNDEVNGWQGYVDKNSDEIDDNIDANQLSKYQDATANAPFDQDQYIILNTAVNGDIFGDAGGGADPNGPNFLGDMYVDYVRVYQCPRDPLIPEGTGCKKYLDTQSTEPYYSDPYFRPRVLPEISSFVNFTEIFIDGPGPESIIGTPLTLETTNTISVQEVNGELKINAIPDGTTTNFPRVAFAHGEDDVFILSGFDSGALGDLKFDLFIESYVPGQFGAGVAIGMSSENNGVKTSKFIIKQLSEYETGKWHRVVVPVQDILNGTGSGFLDNKKISEVMYLMFNSEAEVRIDNIQIACGAAACGVVDEVPVYIDGVDGLWTRGIRGNDSEQNSTLYENPDYDDGTCCHVKWEEIDTTGENHSDGKDHKYVVQTSIGSERGTPEDPYPSQAVNFVGSINAISAIAALADGEFRFDIRMISNPNDVDLYFKVDGGNCLEGINCTSTGEQPLGDLPIGQWETFACSIENLALQGLNVSTITAPFVMVPGISGTGKDVVFQWDNVIFSPVKENPSNILEFPITFPEAVGGFCLPIAPFSGGSFSLVQNPYPNAGHSDTKVGKTSKVDYGVTFGGITLNFEQPIVFGPSSSGAGKLFTLKALTTRDPTASYSDPADNNAPPRPLGEMNVTFKLEGVPGTSLDIERTFTLSSQDQWEDIVLDFNGSGAGEYSGLTLIIDNGYRTNGAASDWTLYFDEIERSDSTSVVASLADDSNGDPVTYTFDDQATYYYPPPTGVDGARANIVNDPVAVNGRVVKVVYDVIQPSVGKGVTFVGSDGGFPDPIPFANGRTTIEIDVWTEEANREVLLKVEDAQDQFRYAELTQVTPNAGWNTLTFDFSTVSIEYWETFEKLMLIFDPNRCVYNPVFDTACPNQPADDEYYFDNIRLLP